MRKHKNLRRLRDRRTISEQLSGWLFVLPMLILFIFFFGWPIIKTVFYLGFTKYGMIGQPQWIGLENYRKLFFQDPNAKSVLLASLRIPLMLIPVHVVLSLPLAWLVFSCRNRLARSIARATLYVPTLVTTGAVAVAWNFIFSTDNGPLNYALRQMGLIETQIPWLVKSEYAMWAIVIFSAWKFIGLYFLYYYVAMQNIPESYYEAARIDGANAWQQFRGITLPMLSPTISFIIIIVMTGALQAFDEPYFITSGGPGYFTTNATLYIYRKAFKSYEMGYSAAISTILFIAVLALTAIQQWLQKRWVVYDYE